MKNKTKETNKIWKTDRWAKEKSSLMKKKNIKIP